MTLLEYVQSLQDQGEKDIASKVKKWKEENQYEAPEVSSEAKINPAAAKMGAAVAGKKMKASNKTFSDSVSIFGNGKSQYQEGDFSKTFKNTFGISLDESKKRDELLADYNAQMAELNKVSKIDDVYSPGDGYDYKFSIDPESNTLKYEAKEVGSEEFKEKTGIAAFSIANMFGHLDEEQSKQLAEINAQNKAESEKQKKREKELLKAKEDQLTAMPLVQEGVVESVDTGISFTDQTNYLINQLISNSEESTLKLKGRNTRLYRSKVEEYINSGMSKQDAEAKATSESSVVEASYDVTRDSADDIINNLKGYTDQEKEDVRLAISLSKKLNKAKAKNQTDARMRAAAPFSDIKDSNVKEEQKSILNKLDILNKKYTGETTRQVATPEALANFTEQFNTLQGNYGRGGPKTNEVIFNQTINSMVKNDPFIKAELLKLQINADQEIKDFSAELQKKYDTSTVEGNKKATEELQQFAKSLTQDKLLEGDVFKERFSQIQTVGVEALGKINLEDKERELLRARMQDPIFKYLEIGRKLPGFKFAALGIEGIMKGGKRFQDAVNVVQKDFAADGAKDSINMISSLEKALKSGEVDLTTKLSFDKGGFMTVEKALDYFKKAKNYDEKNIIEQLDDLSEIRKDLSLYREIDPEDSWLTRTFQTVAESAPMMTAALGGSVVTYLTGGTASAVIAPLVSTLGTAALFTQFYGDAWEDTFMEGARSEAKSKGIDLDNISEEERRDFLLQALQSGKYDKSANATATAALQTATEKFGFSKQMSAASKALGLGKEGITSLIQGQWRQTGKAFLQGSLAKAESALSEGVTEWSQTVIGDLNRGFAYDKGTSLVDFSNAWEAGKAGASAGLLMPGGAAIISQTRVEIQNLSRKIAIQFAPDSSFGQASLVADNYFKAAQTELNQRLELGVNPDGTEYTVQQHQEDTNALASTSNAYRRIPNTASTEVRTELLDLMVRRDKLQLEINKVNDSDLTVLQQLELNSVKDEIKELAKEASAPVGVKTDSEKLKKGAGVAISQLGAGVERVDNTEDFISSVSSLEAQGVEANINRNEAGEILPAEEQDYGIFAKVPDGKGGFDVQLIINDASAKADGLLPADKHELLHVAAMKMDDASKVKMGGDILNSLLNDSNIEINRKTRRLLNAYKLDLDKGDITVAEFFEEVMAVTSDGLTPSSKTGVADIRVKDVSKFKAIGQKILQAIGWRQNFADGQQAINFLKDFNADVLKGEGLSQEVLSRFDTKADTEVDMSLETEVDLGDVKASKKDTGAVASTKVQEIYDTQGEAGAFDIIDQFKPIVSRIVEKRRDAPNFDRQLLTDEIETGKRGIFDLIREYNPESGVPLAAYINKFLPARAIEASQRVLGEEFTSDVTEARGVMAEEVETEVAEKPVTRKIKPSSLISNDAVVKIKEQVQEKIKGIDPKNLTFKKLGDLAPEIIAAEIGIPVKKLISPTANLSKGDATAIQQFVNKNADKLLKILPEGAVIEAATEKLLGTSTGVPKGLLNAFYTKQARLGKGAGLAPFKLNKGISKADFLETFGIVEGKKAEGFDARSPQAQALKGIASLYGKLVTNEIVRSDTDLSLEAKQDVAAGKSKAMASKRMQKSYATRLSLLDELGIDYVIDGDILVYEGPDSITNEFIGGDSLDVRTLDPDWMGEDFMAGKKPTILGQTIDDYRQVEQYAVDLDRLIVLDEKKGQYGFDQTAPPRRFQMPFFLNLANADNLFDKSYLKNVLDPNVSAKENAARFADYITDERLKEEGVKTSSIKFSKRIDTEAAIPPALMTIFKDLSTLRNKKQLAEKLGFSSPPINESNRKAQQDLILEAVIKYGLDTATIEAGMMGSGGRQSFYGNIVDGKFVKKSEKNGGKKYVKTTDGEYILENSERGKLKGGEVTNWVAKPGRLYYGNEDPAFQTLIKETKKYEGKKAKRVGVKGAFTEKSAKQSEINMGVLDHVVNQLANAVAPVSKKDAKRLGRPEEGMSLDIAGAIIIQSYQATSGLVKISAPFKYKSILFEYAGPESKVGQRTGEKFREEHNPPASVIGAQIMFAIKYNAATPIMKAIKENYYQTQLSKKDDNKIDMAKLDATLIEGQTIFDNPVSRLAAAGIDLQTLINPLTGKTIAEESGFGIDPKVYSKYNTNEKVQASSVQNEAILEGLKNPDLDVAAKIKASLPLVPGKAMASKRDSDLIPDAIKYDRPITVQTAINALEKTDKALANGRKLDQPVKKIRVFDFDDTLARTKSNVLYTMPDGTTGAIDAATFAKEAGNMEAEGAQWDFSEFSKVMQGSKGPLLDVAKIIADKRGTKDVFVLTARPADAAGPIKEFLASMGLDIPLANITGLGDGTPQAKAGWIMGKAAEGYNDFYFADDHTGNVKAVKDVLSQIDVKSKVQLAKASKRQTFDTVVNDMIEDSSGIETYKKYSAARAKTVGASKGKYAFLIPPSAEDFTGLLYKMIGKGKKGDAQMAFLKTNLLDTYNRAESAVTQAKISAANDFVALKTKLKTLPKTLSKETGIGKFTYSHAVRVAAWTKQGMDIPGLSKRDVKELNDFVNKDAKLRVFTDELIKIQKGKEYPKPGKDWLGGNITTDIIGGINKVNRAEYQQEFRENIDIIFSEDNMNKMEAAYGSRWREAMEDSIRRMKSGSNRPIGGNRVTEGLLNWLNNSVGAVMFLNTRSALLQTISAVNFINLGDNNIIKAGRAFANQKQFWGDFMTLMNSDYLVERRNGLKINVSESEIADAVRESKNKPKAAIAFLLSKGFVMTRFADSFAIASGGSTFYRNRLEALKKQGLSDADAETQAFEDFKAIAEENQQSSSPSKISQQQASAAGRVILAWANTPMQYARIQKRAAQDLINGRGDWKSNVSKIVYYGAIQNLIFNSLQQAVFALGFGDDEEETDEAKAKKRNDKAYEVVNGMIDSQLRGLGIFGSASAAIKNTLMTLYEEHGKKTPKYENAVEDLLSFSPPLGSKIGKITGGLRSASWNKKDMKEKGFSLDNPAYMAGAQVVTGLTNIPLDRVAKKINNLRGLVNERSALWQKVALGLGWGTWELGLGYYGGFDKEKPLTPKQQLKLEVDTMKKDTSKADQVKTLLDFGLTKKQIRELKNENNRVKKILELQKKDKDAGSKK